MEMKQVNEMLEGIRDPLLYKLKNYTFATIQPFSCLNFFWEIDYK